MVDAGQFFSPWDPPPGFSSPPQDPSLAQRVAKLAEFAARNGPSFVDVVRTKQQSNPEYAFLRGGLGAEYYAWVLYCSLYNLPQDQPLPGTQQPAPIIAEVQQRPVEALPSLPPAVEDGFRQVIAPLLLTHICS